MAIKSSTLARLQVAHGSTTVANSIVSKVSAPADLTPTEIQALSNMLTDPKAIKEILNRFSVRSSVVKLTALKTAALPNKTAADTAHTNTPADPNLAAIATAWDNGYAAISAALTAAQAAQSALTAPSANLKADLAIALGDTGAGSDLAANI